MHVHNSLALLYTVSEVHTLSLVFESTVQVLNPVLYCHLKHVLQVLQSVHCV
jgi:hypothetical protein